MLKPVADRFERSKLVINESIIAVNALSFLFYSCKTQLGLAYADELVVGWINIGIFGTSICCILAIDVSRALKRVYIKLK